MDSTERNSDLFPQYNATRAEMSTGKAHLISGLLNCDDSIHSLRICEMQ
jgi:hypothetical protein